ncbi:hypothetical protein EVAR_2502_1 [Eumeta japonica]|uniref:Uncharacterized protein n=1 Tax=Eumeta variegata TaxID=151549 RepID=A0A4C1SRD2_EUMVA|nr:hypothetical protein EVAR_2502_1 [Eumeta japonica]
MGVFKQDFVFIRSAPDLEEGEPGHQPRAAVSGGAKIIIIEEKTSIGRFGWGVISCSTVYSDFDLVCDSNPSPLLYSGPDFALDSHVGPAFDSDSETRRAFRFAGSVGEGIGDVIRSVTMATGLEQKCPRAPAERGRERLQGIPIRSATAVPRERCVQYDVRPWLIENATALR